jgi:hypothetical protein
MQLSCIHRPTRHDAVEQQTEKTVGGCEGTTDTGESCSASTLTTVAFALRWTGFPARWLM